MGGDKKRLVKIEHVKLLENIDQFYRYPWGRIGFEELNRSLTTCLSTRMTTVEKAKALSTTPRLPYSIQGMPIVFQVWIYEAIKSVGLAFAERLNDYDTPRGLRWIAEETPGHGIIELVLEDAKEDLKPILQPEEEEVLLSSCSYSDELDDDFYDNIVKQFEGRKEKTKRKQTLGTQKKDSLEHMITELAQGVKRFEKLVIERIQSLEDRLDIMFVPKRKTQSELRRQTWYTDLKDQLFFEKASISRNFNYLLVTLILV